MRQIKFRAWWKRINTMQYFDTLAFLNFDDDVLMYQEIPEETPHGIDRIDNTQSLMQYTGLKDKNGIEIYEGDILSTDLSRPCLVVEFRSGAFMFQCHDNGEDYYDFMTSTDDNSNFTKYHEVIGNIYENPELLEEEK